MLIDTFADMTKGLPEADIEAQTWNTFKKTQNPPEPFRAMSFKTCLQHQLVCNKRKFNRPPGVAFYPPQPPTPQLITSAPSHPAPPSLLFIIGYILILQRLLEADTGAQHDVCLKQTLTHSIRTGCRNLAQTILREQSSHAPPTQRWCNVLEGNN